MDVRQYRMLIGGEFRDARSGVTLEAVNPSNGELFARFPKGGPDDVDDAVEAAAAAFPAWWATPPLERAASLEELAAVIAENAPELAMLDVTDNGSPIREMRKDAFNAARLLRYFAGVVLEQRSSAGDGPRYFAGVVLEQRGDTIPGLHGRLNYTLRHPLDRKSTRLNSSHANISYAVFCL